MKNSEAGMNALHAEAGGTLAFAIYRAAQVGQLLGRVILGDDRAGPLLRVVQQAMSNPQPGCMCCDRDMAAGKVAAVAIVAPDVPAPRHGLAGAICAACAVETDTALTEKLCAFLKKSAWPDLRVISPVQLQPKGGRA